MQDFETLPLLASTPLGMSTLIIYFALSFIISITSDASPSISPLMPVPKIASTTKSAVFIYKSSESVSCNSTILTPSFDVISKLMSASPKNSLPQTR